uniref:Acetyl-CoA carboxylase n=1 Tax=Aegilops tauschii TaxID=37682 RepID=M8BYH2_AEGTA
MMVKSDQITEFCKALGGDTPIRSVLVANNGMAAVKFMRSIRAWASETFGTDKAVLLVAMATPEDLRANAEHVRIADQFLEVPGGTNNNNYANVQLIVEIAERTRISAVWPGWGHASEDPELPDALKEKGIIFLGPPSAAMAALGDKIGSSLIAQAAGVPTLPWSGSHVKVPQETCHSIPEEIYKKACVSTTEEAVASCQVVGYPAMIKASWGGGGKGIRKVHNDDEVRALFKQVQGEVPGSPIFVMKLASQSRHLEVQLLCDKHGNVAALHSRDCSVQRRHQKIIEEGPITVAPPEKVRELEQAARRLAKCVQYQGAATVEYLYSMETGEYYFLELNPRLQVEHPVTEWIAGVNLPASQVVVGMGIPLYNIPEIRRFYGVEHGGGYHSWKEISAVAAKFDLDKAQSVRPTGHCVAVRVTSEDPDDGFKPTGGRVEELNFKSKPNVWAYFSVKSGGAIHEFSDSQFGHVFAFGESRSLAIANMVLGLKEIQIRGDIRTNVDYTVDLLNAAEYRENKIHTGWLDSRIAMRVRAERPPWYLSVVAGALYEASSRSSSVVTDYVGYLSKGQIPPRHISLVNLTVTLNIEGIKYTVKTVRGGPGSYKLRINESEIEAEMHSLRDGGLLMQLDGNSHKEHDPSKLLADTPCKLLRFLVADGSHVVADTPYAEVEVMKMCMPLLLPASGVIHFVMPEGQAMQASDLIARLDLDDPSSVRKAEPFHGTFPKLGPSAATSGKVHQKFAASMNSAHMILAGYEHNISHVVQDLLNCLDSPELPFLRWQELMSVLATRLPKDLRNELDGVYKEYELNADFRNGQDFPAKLIREVIEANLAHCSEKDRITSERPIEPLMSLVKSYEGGRESHACVVVKSLFEEYLSVEELFSDDIQSDVIERLRLQHAKDLEKVVYIVFSHQGVKNKNELILQLMDGLVYPNPSAYRDQLMRFSALNHTAYSGLALKAIEDALVALFDHSDPTLQRRVVETYIRRLYEHYLVRGSVRIQWHRSGLIALWEFSEEHIGQSATLLKQHVKDPRGRRWGVMVVIKSLQCLSTAIEAALKETSHYRAGAGSVSDGNPINSNHGNILHIALVGISNQMSTLQDSGDEDQAQERINKLSKILKETITSHLNGAGVRVVSCIIQRDEGRPPMRHSFKWSFDKLYYEEDPMLRHVEPPLSTFLELDKVHLEGYSDAKYTPSRDRQWHIYTLVNNSRDPRSNDQRMFLRTIVRQPSVTNGFSFGNIDNEVCRAQASSSLISNSILRSLMAALEEVELHAHNEAVRSGHSHMYMCILREQRLFDLIPVSRRTDEVGQDEETACTLLKHMATNIHEHVGVRMHRLSVCQWEVKLWLDCDGQASAGPLHGIPLHEPYKPLDALDQKLNTARKNETTYCYDFPLVFEKALKESWKSGISHVAEANGHNQRYAQVTELMFADSTGSWGTPLVPVERPPGMNDIGTVAWKMKLSTPEFPDGREIIVVANDVTFKAGSFGPREDAFFDAVTNLACERKIPLIYLAATSGARLGVADEIKACFHVGWSDDEIPERGFHYIYLMDQDYSRLRSSVIAHELKLESGETRWVVDTIVGKEDGLGCENLHGSGAIASAYSKAYRETFTLTFVTGKAVGIGAYLARIGMRCIQRLDQPIILTGFSPLNKLLGREVYSSQLQLGGPKIMAANGVAHLTVSDDLEGVSAILKWLSYVPPYVGGPLPILKPLDPPERPVTYFPQNSCDARAAICGLQEDTQGGKWLGGMFDRESFVETLGGWAKTVITGRAKLGGIPVGVIAVETETMMQVTPADPGQLDSAERVVPQAGQVWFPDSAAKTAQALLDFNHEELPLFILANWRGFSGGQRDLFEGILQAGSMIVENLRTYKQPAFVYIPKAGELRGGAWVVVDSKVNPEHIEMYAERSAKGNVLEPKALIEIKFKPNEVEESMLRLDPQLARLNARLLQEIKTGTSETESIRIRSMMAARTKQLMPIYTQVATWFAELHDTTSRMIAKGVISKVVDWEESRAFFFRRLRRRVAEDSLAKQVREAAGEQMMPTHGLALERIKEWHMASQGQGDGDNWNDDEAFFAWKDDCSNYDKYLEELKAARVSRLLSQLAESSDVKALPNGLSLLLGQMNPSKREQVIDGLRQLLG